MTARQKTRKQRARRQRLTPEETTQALLLQVQVAEQSRRRAEQNLRMAIRRAQYAGLPLVLESEVGTPDIEIGEDSIQLFPGGLGNPDHGHVNIQLAEELSPECLAELAAKATGGRVTYARRYGEPRGWWNHRVNADTSMAAD